MITLGEVAELANTLLAVERDITAAELALKETKERARVLREESIPSAMQELGMQSFRLSSGEQVTVKQDVYASIPVASRGEAFEWLEEHGFGGLIKTELALHFSKGEAEQAEALAAQLRVEGVQPELERAVHPQTLKAFLREQLESGAVELPLDLFGARPVMTTIIKR